MKYCIVNGDDFGASRGINRAIVEAHYHGVLTSTSLMVNMPASEEAATLSRKLPQLSVGLHVNLTTEAGDLLVDPTNSDQCRTELYYQLERFQTLMGGLPTHLDSHRNIHRSPQLLPHFLNLAQRYQLPLREHSPIRYFSSFYGQWDGETHLEQISSQHLIKMIEAEFLDGFTELSCHPGYVDSEFSSSYAIERETELKTLCDPAICECLEVSQIQLINFREAVKLLEGLPA